MSRVALRPLERRLAPGRTHRYASGHNVTLLGDAEHKEDVLMLTKNLFSQAGSMVITPYFPGAVGGVPVRTFDSSWVHTIGRGNGADGYSFVFGDLREVAAPFGEMGIGDGLAVRFRTHAYFTDKSGCEDETCEQWNQGYGLLQLVYNGTLLNETHMQDKLREPTRYGLGLRHVPDQTAAGPLEPARVRVVKDETSVTVYYGGVAHLVAALPDWAPQVYWAFGFGARTGERKDEHWIDELQLQSGYMLDTGLVGFGVSLNRGADVSARAREITLENQVEALTLGAIVSSKCVHHPDEPGAVNIPDSWCVDNCGIVVDGVAAPICPPDKCDCTGAASSFGARIGTGTSSYSGARRYDGSTSERGPARVHALPFTYTTYPSVLRISPTTGPTAGNTTVRLVGSTLRGGADYRCLFHTAAEHDGPTASVDQLHPDVATAYDAAADVPATFDEAASELSCTSPPHVPGLGTLEVSLNGRRDSTSSSRTGYRFYFPPVIDDARGPSRYAAPAGGGSNVSLLGGNFSFGDDYRVAFLTASLPLPSPFDAAPSPFDPEPSRERADTTVQATFVNDSLLLCVAPPYIGAQSAALRLTLNGQQFTQPPTNFPFFSVAPHVEREAHTLDSPEAIPQRQTPPHRAAPRFCQLRPTSPRPSPNPHPHPHLTLTQVASLSPSTGAVPGGTLVTVNGTAFDAGGAYRCGFGAAGVAEATRVDDAI
jgi:hypothetical protein